MIVIVSKIVQTFDFDKLKKNAKPLLKDLAIASITDNPGELLKKRITKGVNYNDDKLTPLKKSTINIRKMRGRTGNKPLMDTGKLLNSIKTVETKNKIGVSFLKYGLHQAQGFTTNNHFAVKNGNKIVGWRDYSQGIRVAPRSWIYPEKGHEHLGLVKMDKETLVKVIKLFKKAMSGKKTHKYYK